MIRLFVSPLSKRPPPPPLPFPFTGEGLSSLDFRFSGRGGRKAVGDVEGVFEAPGVEPHATPDDELDEADAPSVVEAVVVRLWPELIPPLELVLVDVVGVEVPLVVVDEVRPPRPFAPPFRSLL